MDKVVLVTGASSGIGWATSARLAASGWAVVAASRRGSAPDNCEGLVMDVDDDASVSDGVAKVLKARGRLDALVTCAGWGVAGAFELTPLEEAKAQLETNFWGSVRAVQAVLAPMRAAGGGRVVLLSSIAGLIGIPFQAFYTAGKFALEGLGEALAYEVEPFGVKVTLVEPGNVRTEFTERRRVVGSADQDGGYSSAQAKAISVMERDERNGVAADKVAGVVAKVLISAHPPRRVSVGRASERVGIFAKRLVPFWAFQAGARSSLGV